ncbi:MAG: hypothetical protein J6C33_10870 [Lachnospiraceae bacterium]|nr:hypothetical protein [Lachnospiraceae bacterium]MBO5140151.1 hypothetical protein [Peptococcaceae bacterium]
MKKELTAEEKRDSNFYEAQRMIYFDLPVLISKIFHAAFANCECGFPAASKEDMKFLQGFIDATEKTFNIAMEGQKKQIVEMLKMHE